MFQNKFITGIFQFVLLIAVCSNVQAAPSQPPQTMNYQAFLKDSVGLPVNSTETVTFRIYDAADVMGVLLWSDTMVVDVIDGLFSVELGSKVNPLPKASMAAPLWLGVEIGTDGEATPRTALSSVNNAFRAEDADTLQGLTAADLIQTGDLTVHSADQSAHHTKTKDFSELTGTLTESQIPALIARDTELNAHETDASAHHDKTTSLPWVSITSIPAGFADGVDNDSGGDITAVTTGNGLSGGSYSGDVELRVSVPLSLEGDRHYQGIVNVINNTTSNGGYAINAQHNNGVAIYGYSRNGTGMQGSSHSGNGVFGQAAEGVGVYGNALIGAIGVYGNANTGTAGYFSSASGTAGYFSSGSGYGLIVDSGHVGIGVTAPDAALHVSAATGEHPLRVVGGGVGTRLLVSENGGVAIGDYNPQPVAKLQIRTGTDAVLTDDNSGFLVSGSQHGLNIVIDDNEIMARNNGTKSKLYLNKDSGLVVVPGLEITGGADLVEPFDVASDDLVVPGMVVSIDPKAPGKLRIADKEFDRTVAGIVSGANGINPGLSMAQQESVADGSYPVALTGRLYALADASYGAIEPGDLLTTSGTPGHVMKVTDHNRAQGAVIGKAMTFLGEGKGHVLVLVSLQ